MPLKWSNIVWKSGKNCQKRLQISRISDSFNKSALKMMKNGWQLKWKWNWIALEKNAKSRQQMAAPSAAVSFCWQLAANFGRRLSMECLEMGTRIEKSGKKEKFSLKCFRILLRRAGIRRGQLIGRNLCGISPEICISHGSEWQRIPSNWLQQLKIPSKFPKIPWKIPQHP